MRTPKYKPDNPRILVNIRKNTLQKLIKLYPNENTHQKRMEKIINDTQRNTKPNTPQ